jgi:hypothetical protein
VPPPPPAPAPGASSGAAVTPHDEQAFLDAFTDGSYVDDWGRVFTGREAIQGWSTREFIGATGVLTPEEVSVAGDGAVTVVGDWRSTHANGRSSFRFAVDGDHIASMTIREG